MFPFPFQFGESSAWGWQWQKCYHRWFSNLQFPSGWLLWWPLSTIKPPDEWLWFMDLSNLIPAKSVRNPYWKPRPVVRFRAGIIIFAICTFIAGILFRVPSINMSTVSGPHVTVLSGWISDPKNGWNSLKPREYMKWYKLTSEVTVRMIDGSLEVKLPATDEKQSRAERRERLEERRSEKRKSQKKEDADAQKGREVAKHCVFPMICGSGGSKSRLAKAAGAEPAGQMRDEKLHAVVARSTFRSQNVQSTPLSNHFWKLRCRKSARHCGAKHISKSKCTKLQGFGPLLEVAMSKKCTPLWREAHFQVKMYKTLGVRTTFGSCDVEKVHAVVARSIFWSQKC